MRTPIERFAWVFIVVACTGTLGATPATPVSIVSGYNSDVVAEGSGSPASSTTIGIDGATGFVFYDGTYASSHGISGGAFESGSVIGSDGNQYVLMGSAGNNALLVSGSYGASAGVLTFSTPISVSGFQILATAGYGPTILDYTLNLQGGGAVSGTLTIADWEIPFGTPVTVGGMGRVLRLNGAYDTSENPNNLYSYSIAVSSSTPVNSIAFSYDPLNQRPESSATVFAISQFAPIPEPTTFTLLALSSLALFMARRR